MSKAPQLHSSRRHFLIGLLASAGWERLTPMPGRSLSTTDSWLYPKKNWWCTWKILFAKWLTAIHQEFHTSYPSVESKLWVPWLLVSWLIFQLRSHTVAAPRTIASSCEWPGSAISRSIWRSTVNSKPGIFWVKEPWIWMGSSALQQLIYRQNAAQSHDKYDFPCWDLIPKVHKPSWVPVRGLVH